MNFPLPPKPPANRRSASDFMRNASESERRRVFMKAIERATATQIEVIEKAERMQRECADSGKQ